MREQVAELLSVQYTREEAFLGHSKVPAALSVVGSQSLHPWQVRMYAEVVAMLTSLTKRVLLTRRSLTPHCGSVQGVVDIPSKLCVCVANPGDGKTRLGSLCAFGHNTCVIAVRGTVEHWRREAAAVGVHSVQIGGGYGCLKPDEA